MNIYVILAYFVFIADVLVCFTFYFYSYFLFSGILVICLYVYYVLPFWRNKDIIVSAHFRFYKH